MPYGSKSKNTVIRYSRQIVHFLETQQVKAIVIACNTASALALDTIEKEIDLPIIGVVKPGAQMAVASTTSRTSPRFAKSIQTPSLTNPPGPRFLHSASRGA